MKNDFYIGYLEEYPAGAAKWLRRTAGFAVVLAAMAAVLVASKQKKAEAGLFEFGHPRAFSGVVFEMPFPILHVAGPSGAVTNYVLVGEGKFGAPRWFLGKHGHRVSFQGTLIQKGSAAMIEAASEAPLRDDGPEPVDSMAVKALGPIELTGELVDTKCYFGVMRPGEGKVHRGCAVRCLSGGVPPGLLVRDKEGNGVVVLLAGAESWELLKVDPEWAARLVSVRGELELAGNLPLMRVQRISLAD